MSVLDKKIFKGNVFSRKKDNEKKLINKTGIDIKEPPVLEGNKRLFFIFTNAILNFLIVIGTIGSFVKSFKIKAYMPLVIIVTFIIAVLMAFLYFNTIVKITGYLLSLVLFLYGAFNFRYIIKGGFGYISNILMAFFEKELDLPVERSYDVYGYGEKISVTVCLIFIIFAVMLLFNMVISESKGFVIVLLFTFPVVQLGMYFEQKTDIVYFTIYIIGLLTLFFLRNSRHYHMEYKKRKGYKKRNKKNKVIYDYTNDGKFSLSFVLMIGAIIIAVTALTSIVFPQKKYKAKDDYNEWKESTTDFTKQLIMVGFWGMISPNGGSAGGVGRNRMGQSKYVQLDYQPDLYVRMVPFENEGTVYLKAFNGTFYRDEYWKMISEEQDNEINIEDYGITTGEVLENNTDMLNLYNDKGILGEEKKIEITNVGASQNNIYVPENPTSYSRIYDKINNDDELIGSLKLNWQLNLWYVPLLSDVSVDKFRETVNEIYNDKYERYNKYDIESGLEEFDIEKKYSEYVHDMYMDVPEENEQVIQEFCEKYNLNKDSEDIVEKVADIFEEDYEYTLMPGVTPSSKDFVNYFLTKQKKGYCTYFATSATLIFRYLGIPARYAGGYVLQNSDFNSGELTEEDAEEWVWWDIDGEGKDVLEYEVNDSQAHAWVEIYIDGYGWLPVETTPSSDEEEEKPVEDTNTNALVNFLTNTVLTRETFNAVKDTTTNIVLVVILGFSGGLVTYVVIGIFVRKNRKKYNSVTKQYKYLCKTAKNLGINKEDTEVYKQFGEKLVNADLVSADNMNNINFILEKDKFSKEKVSKEEIETFSNEISEISDRVYEKLSWYKKIIFRYIKWL